MDCPTDFIFDFLVQGSSAFIGALLAFLLGFKLYRMQKRSENLAYLQYSISALSGLMGVLYSFKESTVRHRYDELRACEEKIQRAGAVGETQCLTISKMSEYIYGANLHVPLNIERFEFLVSQDPNLISFVGFQIQYSMR